ncbi:MAG: glycosyltransferase family 4 protein [Desulfosoma sp.]|uniref:glycosyltransferase family 4 protein n=1 Tax=Desulfosoma sp. TaxID=2603217 RepID=UPI004048EFB1
MKIGIDAYPLAGQTSGIRRYILEICHGLDGMMPESEFVLYSPNALTIDPPSARWQVRILGSRMASSYVWLKTSVGAMARADGVHVFWATRTILPRRTNALRTVSTVHDLNYKVLPQSMPYATLWAHKLWFAGDVRRADAVVTNSQGTADRLLDVLGVNADAVARPGVANSFVPQPAENIRARLSILNVRKPYFLAVGTLEPRKNLVALMEAFVTLKRLGQLPRYELLIVGERGWRTRGLNALLDEYKTHGVRWLSFVTDEDLAALYAGSQAFVIPSLYEGFGIPAAEARACGALVVATDIPELRESAGTNAIFIEPTPEGIRHGMLKAAENKPLVSQPERRFSWSEAAQVMVKVFRGLK